MTKERFIELFSKTIEVIEKREVYEDWVKEVGGLLFDVTHPQDITGKTVILHLPLSGQPLSETLISRYSVYGEFIKSMGARGVAVMALGAELKAFDDKDLEKIGLRRI